MRKNFKDGKNFEKNVKKKTQIKKRFNGFSNQRCSHHVTQRLYPLRQGCSLKESYQKLYLNPNPNPNPNQSLGD